MTYEAAANWLMNKTCKSNIRYKNKILKQMLTRIDKILNEQICKILEVDYTEKKRLL